MSELDQYAAAERIEQIVSSVLIGYRLTIGGGTTVESMPWHRDDTLPATPCGSQHRTTPSSTRRSCGPAAIASSRITCACGCSIGSTSKAGSEGTGGGRTRGGCGRGGGQAMFDACGGQAVYITRAYARLMDAKMTHGAAALLQRLRVEFPTSAEILHRDLSRMDPDDPFLERRVRSRLMLGRGTAVVPNDAVVMEIVEMIRHGDFGVTTSGP